MGIIVKLILRSIKEKKLRTLLIIFSITISSALYFGATGASTSLQKMFSERLKQFYGSSDIVIKPSEDSPSLYFHPAKAQKYEDRTEYIIGGFQGSAIFKQKQNTEVARMNLYAFSYEDLMIMNPVILKNQLNLLPFRGRKIIIGEKIARQYGLVTGQNIYIEIDGTLQRMTVAGVAHPRGFFMDDGRTSTCIIPKEFAASLFNARGRVSILYIKVKDTGTADPVIKEALINDLSNDYRRYDVSEPVIRSDAVEWTKRVTMPFRIMLIIVLVTSTFIIYTSFQVLTAERMPVVGTLRSIGATRGTTDLILFSESLLYGIIGGMLGCALGLGVLSVLVKVATPGWMSGSETLVHFTPLQMAVTFFLAVILSLISSAIPIIRASKIPVKDIILNLYRRSSHSSTFKTGTGILLIGTGLCLPVIVPRNAAMMVDIFCIIAVFTGAVLVVPLVTHLFTRLFEKIYIHVFGNIGTLAAKNLKGNKSILNSIALLTIGISGIFMINTVSSSMSADQIRFYKDAKFDVWMWTPEADRITESRIRSVEGVADTYGIYSVFSVKLADLDSQIDLIHGIKPGTFFDYWDLELSESRSSLMDKIDNGRNIIITYTLKNRYDVIKGDILYLDTWRGKRGYRVIGFVHSTMRGGSYALVSERYLKQDSLLRYYNDIFIKTSVDPEIVIRNIQKKFKHRRLWAKSTARMEEEELLESEQEFLILKGFTIMTLVIGFVGVVNNLIISYIERKRSLALFRSVGMSNRQTVSMMLIESLSGGFIGSASGIATGFIILNIVPRLLDAMDVPPIKMYFSLLNISGLILIGIALTLAATVGPVLKSSRLDIIAEIKYE